MSEFFHQTASGIPRLGLGAAILWLAFSFPANGASTGVHSATACPVLFGEVIGVNHEEQTFIDGLAGNLYKLPELAPAEKRIRNEEALRALRDLPRAQRSVPGRMDSFTPATAQALFERVLTLAPVKESLCSRYRGSGKMGYCFGRAFAVHLEALKSRLKKESIRKAWIVGPLKSGDESWRYHVATILRAPDGSWLAIDPTLKKAMPVEEWFSSLQKEYDPGGEARFFSTPASRLFPYQDGKYDPTQLARPVFRGFFDDVRSLFRTENSAALR